MALFRLAHISDLHIGSEPARANLKAYFDAPFKQQTIRGLTESFARTFLQTTHNPDIALKVAQLVLKNRADLSLILITGDIACVGTAEDLEAGLSFLTAPAVPLFPWLSKKRTATIAEAKAPIFLVPGNHDRYKNHLGDAGGTLFDRIFRDHWGEPNPLVQARVLQHPSTQDVLAVIGADFSLRRREDASGSIFSYLGQGRAYSDIIGLLTRKTEQIKATYASAGVVWALHFPPSRQVEIPQDLHLLEHENVVKAADDVGVGLIFAGHIHKPHDCFEAEVRIICAGSATCFMEQVGNWIHLRDIDVSRGKATLVASVDYVWNDTANDFLENQP